MNITLTNLEFARVTVAKELDEATLKAVARKVEKYLLNEMSIVCEWRIE